jgi:hypothetical protein
MKKIVLIQSHCNTEEKLQVLRKNIEKIKDLGIDILLFSHIPLPQDIVSSVKFFLYDSTNPVLWDERRQLYWWGNDDILLETIVPDYSWTVFNQIIKSFNFLKSENYEFYFIVSYDLLIDNLVCDVLTNNRVGKFSHQKFSKNESDIFFDISLVFLSLSKDILNIIINNLSLSEFIKNTEWCAEKYLEIILEKIDYKIEHIGNVNDQISENDDMFDDSTDNRYSIFVDSINKGLIMYVKKDLECNHTLIINEKKIPIVNDYQYILERVESINNFGVELNGIFHNLNYTQNDYKINKITLR